MDFSDKNIKRVMIVIVLIILAVLVFLLIKPIFLSVVGGLILGYIFFPVYRFARRYIKEKNTTAIIVSLIVVAIIFVPLWFITPIMIKQIFELFTFSQTIDVQQFITTIIPGASPDFVTQLTISIKGAISKTSSVVLNALTNQLLNAHIILLNIFLVFLVFFFTLRDADKLREFVRGISPFNKVQGSIIVKNFKEITDSIIFGQVVIGLLQGILVGIGLIIFGVPNALVLTVIAIVLGILPIVGPPLIWIPLTIYMLATGHVGAGIGFGLYNLIAGTGVEYILRSYIVSRRTTIPTVIILVGMIGGLFIFGILGFILGPLILAYFLILLRAYKDRALSQVLSPD